MDSIKFVIKQLSIRLIKEWNLKNFVFTGQYLNQSLLVMTFAQRIATGDIELVEKDYNT